MGTGGSVEMKIKDELIEDGNDKRFTGIKKHSSQPHNVVRNKNDTNGVRQSQSLFSIDTSGSPLTNQLLPVPARKENELKITKEQDILALQRKEQKLDTENTRLRAELQALNRLCQKLRAERDTATESCHEATQRAISLDQDREKIQRQFKIFRETKESEIQALLQEKRLLESKFHRMQAHGVATGDDHKFKSSVESIKERVVIPDSPTPPNHWWGAAESETTSLFGSYTHIQNAVAADNNESIADMKNIEDTHTLHFDEVLSNGNYQLTNSSNFGSNSMLPDYTDPEYFERNSLRCYITGTADCHKEVASLLKSEDLKLLTKNCAMEGYFLSIVSLEGLNLKNPLVSSCHHSVSVDEIVSHTINISDLVICFIGHEAGRYTELECRLNSSEDYGSKTNVVYLLKECNNKTDSDKSESVKSLRTAIENSRNGNVQYYNRCSEGVAASIKEIKRIAKMELGVGIDEKTEPNEVGCVDEIQLDESIEQEQREIAFVNENDMKPIGFRKYYERLNDLVSSPGPTPPLLISGGCGSGKTTLIKSWVECLRNMNQNFVIFQHFVTSSKSATADPVVMMRRMLFQVCAQLPPSLAPPSFALSSYDVAHLKVLLPRWLERVSTTKNARVLLAIDSMDMITDSSKHFKWLLDPLPVGLRVVISVGANSCPDIWRQWPTLHLEPFSFQCVRAIMAEFAEREKVQFKSSQENDVTAQCRTASTCHPLYVVLLLKVLCSVCMNNRKETFFQSCLKTRDCSEMYRVLLKHIESECINTQIQEQFIHILQLIYCSRSGLNECELLRLIPGLSWQTWSCLRLLLVQFCILSERAGLVCVCNSSISSVIAETYIQDKIRKSSTRLLIQYFARNSSLEYRRTAEMLPWLLRHAKSVNGMRECLLQPNIFHNLYLSGRAGELVEYWQYCDEDKQGIVRLYMDMLLFLSRGELSSQTGSSSSLFSGNSQRLTDHLLISNVYESVGRFLRDLGLMEDAVTCIQRSMEIRESELDPDHPFVADSLHYLATVYIKWKKYAMAEPLLKHSLELVECAAGREHPRVIQELQSLSFVIRKQERHDQADIIAKRIHSLQDRNGGVLFTSARLDRLKKRTAKLEDLATGQESVNLANSMNELGVLCYVQKKYSSAESFLKKSLAMREKLLGKNHADVAQCLHNLSAVYNEQKFHQQAVDCMKKSLKIRREIFGEHNPLVFSTAKHLAILYKKSQQYELARDVYEEVLKMSKVIQGDDSSITATAMVNLAVVESQIGQHDSALPLYQQALDIYAIKHGSSSKQVADTLRNIAVLRYDRKEFEEAAALYKKSMLIREELKFKKKTWK
ncbi:nephrocystin-3-like [Styela clava]